jgi:hypothetical protein
VSIEDGRASDFAVRMAFAVQKDPAEAEQRTRVNLMVVAVTLGWLVIVPILVVFGLTGRRRGDDVFSLAAFLTMLGPFVAAVIATRGRRFGLGGFYVVLTLLMVLPALAILRAG